MEEFYNENGDGEGDVKIEEGNLDMYEDESFQKRNQKEMIDRLLEEADQANIAEFDEKALKKSIVNLELLISKNQELRTKFQNQPDKFIDSEVELHEEIKVIQQLTAYPELLTTLMDLEGIPIILSLLSHENNDIVGDIVELLNELTDSDFLIEVEEANKFIHTLLKFNLFEHLISILYKINDGGNTDDDQIVSDLFSVLENFMEFYPESATLLCQKTKILSFLIKKLKNWKIIDHNQLFASEILVLLIQNSSENQVLMGKYDGMAHLLKILTKFAKNDPESESEQEYVKNLVDVICCCLLTKENQNIFRENEGIDLLLGFMKENKVIRHIAIKILDYATQNNYLNCKNLVESEGLKCVFSYFMGKGFKKTKSSKIKELMEDCEINCISTVANLCKFTKGVEKDRLIFKFKENKHEKIERLIEFYLKYRKIAKESAINLNKKNEDEEPIEDEKLDNGLFTLQTINVIIGYLLGEAKQQDITEHFKSLFSLYNIKISKIINQLEDLERNLGDDVDFINEDTEEISPKKLISKIVLSLKKEEEILN